MAISVRLDAAIEQRLDYLAAKTGRTKAYYLRELIARGLNDLEDLYLAEQRLVDIRAGKSETIALDDAERCLGSAD